ncbi:hypothetical protein Q4494_17165 [Celeribacter halophilus]|uniref:GIY-YIG domain-containing protein n=1 Tax=Celeribacter halophilus TaxID=576117 RepID=A0AAW7XXW7_9RHOB|nr:hypothetical protein [Celeribacter halophilus]MDO6458815.1 hypothetical protein [Celeribacter halophilus]
MLRIEDEKNSLQQIVDSGQIQNANDLQIWIWRRGWDIRITDSLSERRHRILNVYPGVAKKFQIEAPFNVDSYEFRKPGIWIYALLARSHIRQACYIGQSSSVMRRMSEHAKRSRPGRGSDAFFRWSEQNNAEVNVLLLELSRTEGTKGDTARRATILEGSWLKAAVDSAFEVPDIEKWGRLPNLADQTRSFQSQKIWKKAKQFSEVIEHSPPLKFFWLGRL